MSFKSSTAMNSTFVWLAFHDSPAEDDAGEAAAARKTQRETLVSAVRLRTRLIAILQRSSGSRDSGWSLAVNLSIATPRAIAGPSDGVDGRC